jgi:methylenetetrahydrofolate dehydrogenase (NADP+) / methenyltetrahydrofolate cyclohydrolase
MTIIFDGKEFAKKNEGELREKVVLLKKKGITPKLVSIVVGDVDGAIKYQEMKKKAGERIGIEVEIKKFQTDTKVSELSEFIKTLNSNKDTHGIMIQLPLPSNFSKEDRGTLINKIDSKKDVDGMREDSLYVAPVVKAVVEAIEESFNVIASEQSERGDLLNGNAERLLRSARNDGMRVVVIGAKGFEGKKMVKELNGQGFVVHEFDKDSEPSTMNPELKNADVGISCTGASGLITGDMVKEGVIAIDVGSPKGDFDFESVTKKASFITPVPGGIGPVTIACLMENIINASSV